VRNTLAKATAPNNIHPMQSRSQLTRTQVLRKYSDRQVAQELIRELESFADVRGRKLDLSCAYPPFDHSIAEPCSIARTRPFTVLVHFVVSLVGSAFTT
jgi:hypothetical protein